MLDEQLKIMQDSRQIFFIHGQSYLKTNFNQKGNRVTHNLIYKDDSLNF